MFRKKNFTFIFFFIITFPIFSQSKNIQKLQLFFSRSVEYENSFQQTVETITGSLFYDAIPFSFAFVTDVPVKQTAFINSDGCYFLENDTIYDFTENRFLLEQTCRDFLTWFRCDLGLKEEGYAPSYSQIEDGCVITRWDYIKQNDHPISYIEVYTDAKGTFLRARMYLEDNSLFADTSLYDFKQDAGYLYPTKVVTQNYEDGKKLSTTTLTFENIIFNSLEKSPWQGQKIVWFERDNNGLIISSPMHNSNSASDSNSTIYRTSIPSILTNAGFKFYKKFITSQDMTNCPYYPSCSQYMLQAVTQNGLWGIIQGLERLKSCTTYEHKRGLYLENEDHKHIDNVPPKKEKQK